MRKIFSIIVMALLAITLVACGGNNNDSQVLVVGLEADYPPFNWQENESNDYNYPITGQVNMYAAGYDVEMAKLIAEELGMELEIRMIGWESLIPSVRNDQIDLIIAGMTPTAVRREQIDFTDAYYTVENVVVALADGPLANMESLDDLEGFKGIGQANTIYDDLVQFVTDNHGAERITPLDTVPAVANAVISDVADFTIVELPVALGLINSYPELKIVYEPETNVFELSDDDLILAIGVKKGREDFLNSVNAALATISDEQRTTLMAEANQRSN